MRLICSPSQQALEERALEIIGGYMKRRERAMVIVPSQATFLMERRILEKTGAPGFLDIEVFSFEKLTERALEWSGGRGRRVIGEVGLAMSAKKAILSLEGLEAVGGRDAEGLHQRVAELVSALKMELISPEALRQAAAQSQGRIAQKLADVAAIYTCMEALRGEDVADMRDVERDAIAGMAEYIQGSHVLIHGFETLPAMRLEAIARILEAAGECTVTFELEHGNPIYAKVERHMEAVAAAGRSAGRKVKVEMAEDARGGELRHLFDHLYAYPYAAYGGHVERIAIAHGRTKAHEVAYAAQRILESGLPAAQVGIVASDTAAYADSVARIFQRTGIPYFIDGKRTLADCRAAVLLLSGLDVLAGGWRIDDVLRHLGTGFLPVCEEEAAALAQYARESGVWGSYFRSGFKRGPEDMEDIRQRAFAPLSALAGRMKRGVIEGLPAALAEYMQALEIEAQIEAEAVALESAGFLKDARYWRQVYAALLDVLGQAEAFQGGIPVRDMREMLLAGFESVQIAVVPPGVDEVVMGDITHSIFPHKALLFVLGANEGVLPAAPAGGGVITESELEAIREYIPAFPDRLNFEDQKLYIRRALYGGDQVVVTYAAGEAPPSYIASRIARILPGVQDVNISDMQVHTVQGGMDGLAAELRQSADGHAGELPTLSAYMRQARDVVAEMAGWMLAEETPPQLSPETAQTLFGDMAGSVSVLERYFACPYKHFLEYGIRPREIREYAGDSRDAGVYAHALLDGLARRLRRSSVAWRDATDEQLSGHIRAEAERLLDGENARMAALRDKRQAMTEKFIREEAEIAARAIRYQLSGTEADVFATELRVGFDAPFVLHTPAGDVPIHGMIDRIDTAPAEGGTLIRVVDYKTFDKDFSMTDFFYGLNIQLIVYLMAALSYLEHCGAEAVPAGGFYFNIKLPPAEYGAADAERLKKLRMDGFTVDMPGVTEALDTVDRSGNRLMGRSMNYALQKGEDGVPAMAGANVLQREELAKLMEYACRIAGEAVCSIAGGKIDIAPIVDAYSSPCALCSYGAICRFDPQADVCRLKEKKTKADILAALEEKE